uniref:C-type lectin domain-containing protein n=1 Tax=Cyclopterus lumpus TaxID=8103 RepID=A0A8C2WGX7_CYCLU
SRAEHVLCCIAVFSARSQCQQGWREYENKCYFFSTDTKSWLDANAFCLEQSLWVTTQIGAEIYWIGLNDHGSEGVWEWSDGSPFIPYIEYVILYWLPGQPDNWGEEPGEDCGQVTGSSFGQWNDENCACCIQKKQPPLAFYRVVLYMNIEYVHVRMSFLPPEMQQDFMSS